MALMSSAPGFDTSVIAVRGVGVICENTKENKANQQDDDENGQEVSHYLVRPVNSVMSLSELTATMLEKVHIHLARSCFSPLGGSLALTPSKLEIQAE